MAMFDVDKLESGLLRQDGGLDEIVHQFFELGIGYEGMVGGDAKFLIQVRMVVSDYRLEASFLVWA